MLKYIISIFLIYFFFGFILFIFQRKILFNTSGIPLLPKSYGLNTVKEIKIKTKDGLNLLAWYSKPKIKKPILLYLHGNSFDIGERAKRIERYIEEGWGVVLLAWRGYSGNSGKPTEKNLYLDAKSALKWVLDNTNYSMKEIILYGESLGTGVAVELSQNQDFKSVILEAPFTSIYDIAKLRYPIYPFKFLILDNFDNYSKIDKIKSPIMIISGKKDEIIPHKHSIKLFSKAKKPKECLFIDEAMHNNLYDFGIEKSVINYTLNIWK